VQSEVENPRKIRIAIAGVGNCASSLVQGIAFHRAYPEERRGLVHRQIGRYEVGDIEVVAGFDVDRRKVGRPIGEAIFAAPNNTKRFFHFDGAGRGRLTFDWDAPVHMGHVLDGVAPHLLDYSADVRFDVADVAPADTAKVLRESGAEILVNYMPVGADRATQHYAQACLDAGVGLVNCVPSFIASDALWRARFEASGLPLVGDDIKAQLGATITHRTLARLFADRGIHITGTYQLNTGGNTDFLNMLARERLGSKKLSKTQAVQSQLDVPLRDDLIHVGPSDYVPWLHDNKVCFLRIEGEGFGGVPLNLELRLSVEDSPNSAGMVVDAIRTARLARDAGLSGAIEPACAWTMKHPPKQMRDEEARLALRRFVERCSARNAPDEELTVDGFEDDGEASA
jgi:myo-inositol-1-phosphate synthase